MRCRAVWGGASEAFVVHLLTGRDIRVWRSQDTTPYSAVMQNCGAAPDAARGILDVIWVSGTIAFQW